MLGVAFPHFQPVLLSAFCLLTGTRIASISLGASVPTNLLASPVIN